MRRFILATFAILVLLPVGGAAAPESGGVTEWKVLSDQNALGQIGLLRFGQKTLVTWTRQRVNKYDLLASVIAANGSLTTKTIVTSWDGIGDSVLVPTKNGGARVFFNGARKNGETQLNGMNTATTPASLGSWTLAPASIVVTNQSYVRPPSATVAKDFTPFEAWHTEGFDLALHRGLDRDEPDRLYDRSTKCCVVYPNLATDRTSGAITLAWCADSERSNGIFTQGVNISTGQPLGPKTLLAGSSSGFEGKLRRRCDGAQRTGMTARKGGGVYVAAAAGFPTAKKVLVWKLGQAAPVTVATSQVHHAEVSLSSDADGHVWVAWLEATGGASTIGVRRSDAQGKDFGPTTTLTGPAGNAGVYQLTVAAVPGGAWVFARALLFNGKNVIYYTKVTG